MAKKTIRILGVWRNGSQSKAANRAYNMANLAANAFRQMSHGQWDVDAYGITMFEEYWNVKVSAPHYGISAMRQSWTDAKNFPELRPVDASGNPIPLPDWEPTHWHMLGGYFQGQCGQANLNSSIGRTNTDMGCGINTMIHELGHNFGLGHSNLWTPDGIQAYRDRTGYMGSNVQRTVNHVAHQYALGLHDEDELLTVTKNCRFLLAPWETARRARHDDEYAFVRIANISPYPVPGTTEPLFVSVRKRRGFPYTFYQNPGYLPETPEVHLHTVRGASVLVHRLVLDEPYTGVEGVTISYVDVIDDRPLIEVVYDNDNTPVKDLREQVYDLDFPLEPGTQPEPGIYGNPFTSGQGVELQQYKDKRVLYWYTFTNWGKPDWFVASFAPGHTKADLLTVNSGRFYDPARGEQELVGVVRLLEHNGKIHLDFSTKTHGRGSVEVEPVSGVDKYEVSTWYNPKRNNEGFTFYKKDDRIFGYWYTFDSKGERLWYYLDGTLGVGGTWLIDVYATKGSFIKQNRNIDFLSNSFEATLDKTDTGYLFQSSTPHGEIKTDLIQLG
jgi:hypothetical protein